MVLRITTSILHWWWRSDDDRFPHVPGVACADVPALAAAGAAARAEVAVTPDLSGLLPQAITPDLTRRLRHLADDLDRIAIGAAPTAAELRTAPLLVDWQLIACFSGLSLMGFAAGHPLLSARKIVTSPLWVLAPDLTWARTLSRFYRLGLPAGGAIPAADGSASADASLTASGSAA